MPTEEKENPSSFRECFLDAGGLRLVLLLCEYQ